MCTPSCNCSSRELFLLLCRNSHVSVQLVLAGCAPAVRALPCPGPAAEGGTLNQQVGKDGGKALALGDTLLP